MLLLEAIDWTYAPRKALHIVALLKTKLEHVLFSCDLVFECSGNSMLEAKACLKQMHMACHAAGLLFACTIRRSRCMYPFTHARSHSCFPANQVLSYSQVHTALTNSLSVRSDQSARLAFSSILQAVAIQRLRSHLLILHPITSLM